MTRVLPDRVVIISDFSHVRGGASKLAVTEAGLLVAQGVPVTFFCGDDVGDLPAGVEAVALNGKTLLEAGKAAAAVNGLWNRTAHRILSDWIGVNDTPRTIYHVHGYQQTLSPSVLGPLSRVRTRVVMHAHDYFLACPNGAFFDFQSSTTCTKQPLSLSCVTRHCDKRNYPQKLWRVSRQSIQNSARARLLPEATTLLIHRDMERYLFPRDTKGRIRVIPNPAKPLLPSPIHAEDNHDLVYVGDIHAYKGVELLARAGRHAKLSIRFLGAGQDLEALRAAYPEHRFDGWQTREGLAAAMADARLLVSPTLGPEPFGLAPAEALLSGIPVLLSDSMLLAKSIQQAEMGMSFTAGHFDGLVHMLEWLAHDDQLIRTLSRNAADQGHTLSLSQTEWGAALLAVFRELLVDQPEAVF
ncbi:glycosyltransferase family 4 protein [Sulfitobacter pseudonitzschiae]|uniref:glycosyltransferase family 4 protein n=1 Tax=Pseudosulfitobacter pseudonitzschiae TaxID=1402135 RepID=UPI001AF835DE|nr:glycosyltransferase family 4 protein [Pseudosulfitobacter pseudonitzschiae]MBM2299756.1 glycosyltransferase family 4 protein [Pseudosulfitobacter pseudonitzschiae]MBM2304656.1 glycosyltransferase family 4 protein [Pseudosulfitobacter pseudonitzschiae]MBM2314429.1 glycosyltransferase family 4 protein [Pseudosulfitobacter pseudonitzschiae]MBM2319325.1 glycosyltransferase family 4 protein [Pseudosulfitobacter pseudonitzschiae]